MEINYVYCLVDPVSHQKRYIGKTKNIKERYRKHLLPYYLKAETYKNRWLRKLLDKGLKPEIIILSEVCSRIDDINDVERFWIRIFRKAGHPLTNTTNGGDGGCTYKGQLNFKLKKPRLYSFYHATQANIKKWRITSPRGDKQNIENLAEFCRKNNLSASKMGGVANNYKSRNQHKGWACEKL